MNGSEKNERRVPHQHVPTDRLCPEAQEQWDAYVKMRRTLWKYAYAKAGPDHADDICSKVAIAFFQRLLSGPLDMNVASYLWVIVPRHTGQHLKELAHRAESFVGDDTTKLEDRANYISVQFTSQVELDEAMAVLKKEFSTLQLRAFVLAEAYGLKAPRIAELIGTTPGTVRDALRIARRKLGTRQVGVRLGVVSDDD
ncbi:sigma-70 family RNA polymerase sigma factor [Streptomyces griseosporeus]|uniref:sigma-70 family RNA polymerase sigma factor n=1 Tax=Streptomyces griseosporeus TaxID=1910 RepID=UPI0036A1C5C3